METLVCLFCEGHWGKRHKLFGKARTPKHAEAATTAGAWPLDDGHSSIDADEMLLRWMKTWGQWDVTADAVLRALPSSDKRPSTTTCADGQSYSKREAGKLPENAIMSFSHRPRTAM